jgi:hypothetical protein
MDCIVGRTSLRLLGARLVSAWRGGCFSFLRQSGFIQRVSALGRSATWTAVAPILVLTTSGCELLAGIETGRVLTPAGEGGAGGEGVGAGGAGGSGGTGGGNTCLVGSACAVAIAGASRHACVVLDDGGVWCWGSQDHAQLGQGLGNPSGPVRIAELPPIARIATAVLTTCVVGRDGSVWCWGSNASGECGFLGPDRVDVPIQLTIPPMANVFSGSNTMCATTAEGVAYCWGRRQDGKASFDVPWTLYPGPTQVTLPWPVEAIGNTSTSACAAGDGEMRCWGHGLGGSLANDSTEDFADPVAAVWPSPVGAAFLAGSADGFCAFDEGGQLYCWGANHQGQTTFPPGQPTGQIPPKLDSYFYTPQAASANLPPMSPIVALGGGWHHSCALSEMGAVICWGRNTDQQLGHAGSQPAMVVGINDAVALGVGQAHNCVVHAGGAAVSCWGHNGGGQIDPRSSAGSFGAPQAIVFP